MNQKTIANQISFSGVGLHTGKQSKVKILPAPAKTGILFRIIENEVLKTEIKADLRFADQSERCTSLRKEEEGILTVEHLLSALAGKGIDNAIIEVEGNEIPILDGSAKRYMELIEKAGIQDQDEEKSYFIIEDVIHFVDEETNSEYFASPSDDYNLDISIEFKDKAIDFQSAIFHENIDYSTQIAPARTFVKLEEITGLLKKGLIKGGSLKNALILSDDHIKEDNLDAIKDKYDLHNIEVDIEDLKLNQQNFVNEPARHKLLDLIGDLSLLGKPLKAKISAKRPGHKSNIAFGNHLKEYFMKKRKLKGMPVYDENKAPLYDIEEIKKRLPHRFPFLLVDKILALDSSSVVGVKNVTGNEAFFEGHFPGNPVFPGVLQMEALAQTGGILALSTVEDPENWDTYFLKMDNVKFKNMVRPGDTIVLKMELVNPVRRGIFAMKGIAYVGEKIVSEGILTAQIVKRTPSE